jgi:mannosyl-3-phosphoglycerate phosphatase
MIENSKISHSAVIIFTDLDGTLLDSENYAFEQALPALRLIHSLKIPLVIVSSKTRSEIESIRMKMMPLDHPFITENGGGIFFPKTFPLPKGYSNKSIDDYNAIFIGETVKSVIEKARPLKKKFHFRGFSEMSIEEIVALTGLGKEEAVHASIREFDEPVVLDNAAWSADRFFRDAIKLGLDCVHGGRFLHLFRGGNKGKAVKVVLDIYRGLKSDLFSIALGDSPNDLPMLRVVDKAVLMRGKDGTYMKGLIHPNIIKAPGGGPEAWNDVVLSILREF